MRNDSEVNLDGISVLNLMPGPCRVSKVIRSGAVLRNKLEQASVRRNDSSSNYPGRLLAGFQESVVAIRVTNARRVRRKLRQCPGLRRFCRFYTRVVTHRLSRPLPRKCSTSEDELGRANPLVVHES